MRQALPIIDNAKKPFYGFVITLTSHFPYDAKFVCKQPLQLGKWKGTLLGDYLQAIHYTDEALGEFMAGLKAQGRLQDTIVALYGDHNAIPRNHRGALASFIHESMDTLGWARSHRVGCIIRLPSGERRIIDRPAGEIDMSTTLANLVGLGQEAFPGLGRDLLDLKSRPVVFRDGSWMNEKYYGADDIVYDVKTGLELPQVDASDTTYQATEMLYVSDIITQFDLVPLLHKELQARARSRPDYIVPSQ